MSKAIEMKKAIVEEIADKFSKSTAAILFDYRGLTVEEVTELRKQFREAGVDYKVYKNTLVKRAIQEKGLSDFSELLDGPNAIAFSYDDPIIPAKIGSEFAKTHKSLELKAGIVEGAFLDEAKVNELASIPAREVLIAKLLGSLKAPVSNFAYLLQAVIDKKTAEGEAS
ncbi:50S ribosomal protein L10 [Anoxynatronum buryatiense]|uniref:Large ribosomal subunit protein uL10 n=1 Tax=Anoxynatronum buryatiense TaxID=489973 RepID=A0AA45WYV3_9CLOT|nr:50S ribosomal protein L10 [Anoxynatronum buryatiense]SMP69825.1 LSU ribosomal protein L10P [Anoxynatronum buryatiense]